VDPIYTAGDTVQLFCDIFPGFVHPEPAGVPESGIRKRVVVTERALTIGWAIGGSLHRIDIPMTEEQTANATFRGGTVGDYTIGRDHGCGSCGAGMIRNWKPWPGLILRQNPRQEAARLGVAKDATYGLPSARYTRSRS
jgi:hypothetical protein